MDGKFWIAFIIYIMLAFGIIGIVSYERKRSKTEEQAERMEFVYQCKLILNRLGRPPEYIETACR
jgi:ABC-type Na+ efflux pump permease subunit